MDAFLDKYYFLKSRKFWTFIGAVVTLIVTASGQDPFPTNAVIQGVVALALGYMGTTAWEDVAMKKALIEPTTTVTTPSDNVTVTTSEAAPVQPVIPGRHP